MLYWRVWCFVGMLISVEEGLLHCLCSDGSLAYLLRRRSGRLIDRTQHRRDLYIYKHAQMFASGDLSFFLSNQDVLIETRNILLQKKS
jgi:hypothetical protein